MKIFLDGKQLRISWAETLFGAMLQFQNLNKKISLGAKNHHWLESIWMIWLFLLVRKKLFFNLLSENSVSGIIKYLALIFVLWLINSCLTSIFVLCYWLLNYLESFLFRFLDRFSFHYHQTTFEYSNTDDWEGLELIKHNHYHLELCFRYMKSYGEIINKFIYDS